MGPRLILLVVVAFSVRAQGEARPTYGGRATGSLLGGPATLDPLLARSWSEVQLASLVYDGLYRVDPTGSVQAQLAASLPTIDDKNPLLARVKLRAARFHDGRPVRAADAALSLQRALAAGAWAAAPIAAVTPVHSHGGAIVLELRRPLAPLELALLLAAPQLAVTPAGRAPLAKIAIGSGPYKLRRYEGRRIDLEAFADHHGGRPYLDTLALRWFEDVDSEARAYEAGEADLSLRGAVAFAGHEPKYATTRVDGPATVLVFLGFGRTHPSVTGDVDFRRAVSLAIGRGALRRIGTGERVVPALIPHSPDLGGPTPAGPEVNPRLDEATAALGRVKARGKLPAALELVIDKSRPDDAEVANRLVGFLDRVGVVVKYTALQPAELAQRVEAGQCDLWLGHLVAPTPDPAHAYAAAFAAGRDVWAAGILARGPLAVEAAASAFASRLPIVPLYHRAVRVHHKKILHGVAFDPVGRLGLADAFLFAPAVELP